MFLGFLEATVSPVFVHITALWYKPQEQATRLGLWYSATGMFNMFSGAINYGLGSTGDAHAWKYMCVWHTSIYYRILTDRTVTTSAEA